MSYQLIEDHISQDTQQAFEQIAEAARSGEVIGGAFVLILRKRLFLVNLCGAGAKDPVFTRGALLSLDDQLRNLVRRHADSSTSL